MTDDENLCDDDGHIDEFLAEWHAVDKAAGMLREAGADTLDADPPQPDLDETAARLRAGLAQDRWPFDYCVRACGWRTGSVPPDDRRLWTEARPRRSSPRRPRDTSRRSSPRLRR